MFSCNYGYTNCNKSYKTQGALQTHAAKVHGWCVKHNDDYGLELDENSNYTKNCGCFELDQNCNTRKVR